MSNLEQALAPAGEARKTQMIEMAAHRQAAEVQGAIVSAKKFPRDVEAAVKRITDACKRVGLAAEASYEFPRGDGTVSGPSIRLAEVLAQNWGNVDFGVVELVQNAGESTVMAYCHDLETNTRQTKIFTVVHERHVGKGQVKNVVRLTDPRDIYEMVANQGARRLRACILGIIPGDIVDEAMLACDRTLANLSKMPLGERVAKMVAGFQEFKVTEAMIEARLGHKLKTTTEREVLRLGKVYTAIKDGIGKVEDYFELPKPAAAGESISAAAERAPQETAPGKEQAAPHKEAAKEDGNQRQGATDGTLPLEPAAESPAPYPYAELSMLIEGNQIPADKFFAWAVRRKLAPKGASKLIDLALNDVIGIVRQFDTLVPEMLDAKKGK